MAAASHCIEAAASPDAMFCGECGKAIVRCMANQECHGLVGPDGFCSVCVSPYMQIDAGAELDVRVGGTLAVPVRFRNTSPTGLPLRIERVWTRLGGSEKYLPQPMDWDTLGPGESEKVLVQTPPLETIGSIRFDIAFVAGTGWKNRRETFVFSASVLFVVGEPQQNVTVNQTINAGEGGNTIYAPVYNEAAGGQRQRVVLPNDMPLNFRRAPVVERDHGVRGYLDGPMKGAVLLRTADFIWKGFPDGEAPRNGPIATPDSVLKFGRAKTRMEGGEGDVRLLVRDAKGGVDEPLSRAISRLHFVLFIQKGRLMLHPYGEAGVMIGEEHLRRDDRILQNGDVIRVLPKNGDALQVQVRMQQRHGEIDEVTLVRIPALNGDGTR